jgi:hypothetical protein
MDASLLGQGTGSVSAVSDQAIRPAPPVPWQIWVVIVLLALEGIGNLFSIPEQPAALFWLLGKCLFITGLLKRWIWVYGLFLAFCVLHVIYFLPIQPIASLMNLILIGLAVSARKFYFTAATK